MLEINTAEKKRIKDTIRERVWKLLEEKNVAKFPRPVYGRIPNFIGAEEAAEKLSRLDIWKNADIIKVNPDSPQRPVRQLALEEGKKLIMATPRMREGFVLLDPMRIPGSLYRRAATIRGAMSLGIRLTLKQLARYNVDLVVTGSVAVDTRGHRLGKGEGYAELEYGLLIELGVINHSVPVVTTVHELQIVEKIPRDPYDLVLDYIVTPRRVIRINGDEEKPQGIYWKLLSCSKLDEIPLLKELAALKNVRISCKNKETGLENENPRG